MRTGLVGNHTYEDALMSLNIYGRQMKKALKVAEQGTCNRAQVGVVIVDRFENVVASGSNRQLKGEPSCKDEGCLMVHDHCKRTVHAEVNAILNMPDTDEKLDLYTTHYPCPDCMKVIRQAGITSVYYIHDYKHDYENTFKQGIFFTKLDKDNLSRIVSIDFEPIKQA